MLPSAQGDLYEMRREAQLAYAGEEDARAEKILLGLTRAAPNDAESWFYLGNLYARSNRPEQAIQAYQKSLMLNGKDAKAWHNIGVLRLRESWAAFIRAHGLLPESDPLYARLESLITAMEKIPLDGLNRATKSPVQAAPVIPVAPKNVAPEATKQ